MDRKDKFCLVLDIFVVILYLFVETVFLHKVFTNEAIICILSFIVTGVFLLYYAEITSCRIYRFFYKDEENDLVILKSMSIIDKTFICELFITIGLLVAPAYFGKLVIDSIITDENWKTFIGIIYSIIVVIFVMGISAIICDKIKKIIKK